MQTHINTISENITNHVQTETSALSRIQKQWGNADARNVHDFITRNLINEIWENKALQKIILTNNKGTVTWEENTPAAKNTRTNQLMFIANGQNRQDINEDIILSHPLKTQKDQSYFLASIPLMYNGKYDGHIIGILEFDALRDGALNDTTLEKYDLKFSMNEDTLYSSNTKHFEQNGLQQDIDILNQTWSITLAPNKHTRLKMTTLFIFYLACAGILVPIALTSAFVFLKSLRNEIIQRKDIEKQLKMAIKNIEDMNYKASHDLRGPLTSSLGLMNIVRKTFSDCEVDTAINGVNMAEKSLEKLLYLLDDINDIPHKAIQ